MQVYVLLFNARTENEGIHTVQVNSRHKILMFESFDDATRYSLLLEAQDFALAELEALDSEEIIEFCEGNDYDWEIIEEGKLEIPPENNIEDTQWQPEEKQTTEDEIPSSELDNLRRRLEGLL